MTFRITDSHRALNRVYRQFCENSEAWKLLSQDFESPPWLKLDLSRSNRELGCLELHNSMHPLGTYINRKMHASNTKVAYGGWQEDRSLYEASRHFDSGTKSRSVHLGLDLWFEPGTPILCPFPAVIHSFNNNDNFLDYGPTIILEHKLSNDLVIYSLYGHLALRSLEGKEAGQAIEAGEVMAYLGAPPENGDWPPHLHFQIMLDMMGNSGDFVGVSTQEDSEFYRMICPDPGKLLKLK